MVQPLSSKAPWIQGWRTCSCSLAIGRERSSNAFRQLPGIPPPRGGKGTGAGAVSGLSQSCVCAALVAVAGSTADHLSLIHSPQLPEIIPSTHPTKNERHYFQFLSLHLPHRDHQSCADVVSDRSNQHWTLRSLLLGPNSYFNSIPCGIAGNGVDIYLVRKGAGEDSTESEKVRESLREQFPLCTTEILLYMKDASKKKIFTHIV